MSIDWITVIAQIINFLILVWLLKHFLYRPVSDAMRKREQRIATRTEEADRREADADRARQHFEASQKQLDAERAALLDTAKAEVESQKKAWLEEAHHDIQTMREQWREQIQKEQGEFLMRLRQRGAETFVTLLTQALADMADESLESTILTRFLAQLKTLDATELNRQLSGTDRLTVRSRFELNTTDLDRLTQVLNEQTGRGFAIVHEVAPELIGGIELVSDDHRIGWNLASYLDTLSDRVAELLPRAGRTTEGLPHHA